MRATQLRSWALVGPSCVAACSVAALPTAFAWRFQWWHPLLLIVVMLVVARLLSQRNAHLFQGVRPRRARSDLVVPAIAGLIGAVVLAVIVPIAIGAPDRISQTYDAVFHYNAIARILDTGDASSFDLYRVNHAGEGNQFYPGAWHALVAAVVQLSGASIPLASNVTWVVVMAVAFIPGVVYLTDVVAPLSVDRRVLLPVAAFASTALAPFPYLLLSWGTLYPNALAYALLPTGVALTAAYVLRRASLRTLVVPFVVWFVSEVFAHPRSLFGWAVIVAPLAVVFLADRLGPWFRDPARRRRAMVLLLALAAVVALLVTAVSIAVLRYFGAAQRPISDRLNGGPATAREPLWQALLQGLTLTTPLPPTEQVAVPAVLLIVLLTVGVIVGIRRYHLGWLVAAFVIVAVLYALAAGSNSDAAKIATGLWYKDKYRLMALLPTAALPLIAVGAAALIGHARSSALRVAAIVAVGLAVVSGWGTVAFGGAGTSIAATFALPQSEKNGLLLDADEESLLKRLDAYVPAGQLVVGDPWNGSALSGIYSHRTAMFPHLTGDWDPDRALIATSLDQAGTNPAVCDALDRLDAHYLVADPQQLFGGDPAAAFFSGIDRAVGTPLLTEVARDGSTVLYRISACPG